MGVAGSMFDQAMKKILSLGEILLMAYFRDIDTVMKIVSQIPYVKVEGPKLTPRPGTVCQAISNITLDDGTKGFVLLTGGNINPEETKTVMALLNEHGENQTFVGTGPDAIGDVKPKVKEPDAQKVAEIPQQEPVNIDSIEMDEDMGTDKDKPQCPKCDSADVYYRRNYSTFRLLLSILFPSSKGKWVCNGCGYQWKGKEDGTSG